MGNPADNALTGAVTTSPGSPCSQDIPSARDEAARALPGASHPGRAGPPPSGPAAASPPPAATPAPVLPHSWMRAGQRKGVPRRHVIPAAPARQASGGGVPAQARPVCARPSRPLTPSALRSSGPPERPAGKGAGQLPAGHVTPARWPPRAGAARGAPRGPPRLKAGAAGLRSRALTSAALAPPASVRPSRHRRRPRGGGTWRSPSRRAGPANAPQRNARDEATRTRPSAVEPSWAPRVRQTGRGPEATPDRDLATPKSQCGTQHAGDRSCPGRVPRHCQAAGGPGSSPSLSLATTLGDKPRNPRVLPHGP